MANGLGIITLVHEGAHQCFQMVAANGQMDYPYHPTSIFKNIFVGGYNAMDQFQIATLSIVDHQLYLHRR